MLKFRVWTVLPQRTSTLEWLDRPKSILGNYNYIVNVSGRCENFLSDYGNMITANKKF